MNRITFDSYNIRIHNHTPNDNSKYLLCSAPVAAMSATLRFQHLNPSSVKEFDILLGRSSESSITSAIDFHRGAQVKRFDLIERGGSGI